VVLRQVVDPSAHGITRHQPKRTRSQSQIIIKQDERETSIVRKRIITPSPPEAAAHHEGWLDLDRLAVVGV
jgi:hypothetical protein